jgi:hypothetical protein
MEQAQHRGYTVCIFDQEDDYSWVFQTQDQTDRNKLILVPTEGYNGTKYLHPDRFIIKNHAASLVNHFMWEGLVSAEEHDSRMWSMINNFIDTNKQYLIEDYTFVEDEPFYDYSGGRDK